MEVTRKVTITKQEAFYSDNSPCWNAQVWTKVGYRRPFVYCGIGKFCKTLADAEQYKKDFLAQAEEKGENVIWE